VEPIEEKKQSIYKLVDSLLPEQLKVAEVMLAQLLSGRRVSVKKGKPIVRLGGLWKDCGVEITEADIAEARREMWSQTGEEDE